MDIVVRARRTQVSPRFRQHVTEKLSKLSKLDGHVISLDVEVSKERNPRLSDRCDRVEITCRSRGPLLRAEAAASDRYAALNVALAKLEERLRRAADRRRVHHGWRSPVSVADATAALSANGSAPPARYGADESDVQDSFLDGAASSDGPLVVREKTHTVTPMTLDGALSEMELGGHDFYAFMDTDSGMPSVVHRRRGYHYGVARLAT